MRTSGNGGNEEKTIISFMGSGTGHDARACGMPGGKQDLMLNIDISSSSLTFLDE